MISENEFRRVVLWNRLLVGGIALFCLVWTAWIGVRLLPSPDYGVQTSWSKDGKGRDTLHITSLRGHRLVTHLVAASHGSDATYAGASLPEPIFLLDSEGASIDSATLSRLEWRNEGGGREGAPVAGSAIRALYVELNASTWQPARARQ